MYGIMAQIYMLFVGLGTTIIVARLLGAQGKGVLAIAAETSSLSVGVASFGLIGAMGFFAGKHRYDRSDLFWTAVTWSLGLGWGIGIVVWYFRDALLGSVLKGLGPRELAWMLFSLPASYFITLITQAYIGHGRVARLSALQALGVTVNVVALATVILIFKGGAAGAVIAISSSVMVTACCYAVVYGRVTASRLSRIRQITRDGLAYGFKSYPGQIVNMFTLRADLFLLNFFMGPAVVGVYSVATNLAEKIWLLTGPVNGAVFSSIAGAERTDSARLAATTGRTVSTFATIVGIALAIVSIPLIPIIYGPQFTDSIKYLALLLPGTIALAVSGAYYTYFVAQLGKPGLASVVALIMVAFSAVFYVVLIPTYGALGAAIASSASYSVTLIGWMVLFPRETGIRWIDMVLPRRADWELYWSIVRRSVAKVRSLLVRG